jgi:hypothetical protein
MTATDERAAGTAQELEQVAPGSLAYVTATAPGAKWDLARLAGLLRDEAPAPVEPPKVEAASPVKITPELRAALRRLPDVFGSVVLTEPRKLEQAEVDRITEERDVISQVVTALGRRDKDIDEALRHHMDAYAQPSTPVIAAGVARGHRLLASEGHPFEVPVTGMADAWQQRRVAGKAELSVGLLADLLADGSITRAEFNALTVPVRELDEARIRAATRRSPARVLSILRAITTRKGDTAQLVPPKK